MDSDELHMLNFYTHPIWGFSDDDGDEVMPVDYPGHLIWSNGGESLFVRCEYLFNDGTKSDGVVGVRMTTQSVYILKFPHQDGTLFSFPVNSPLEGTVTPAQLAYHLGKKTEDTFPIRFSTPFVFDNGKKLAGAYNPPF